MILGMTLENWVEGENSVEGPRSRGLGFLEDGGESGDETSIQWDKRPPSTEESRW